jgi:MFS family permease
MLFFFYEFIQMNIMNSLGTYLAKEFNMNATQLGLLSAWYFYGNMLCVPMAGILLDRLSTRWLMTGAMVVCSVSVFMFSLSHNLYFSAACRFLTGLEGAFCLVSAVRLASRWFEPRRMALMTGLAVMMAMFGGIVAQTPVTVLAQHIGWRQTLWVDVALGVVLTALIAVFVRDYPPGEEAKQVEQKQALKGMGFWSAKKLVFGNLLNWCAALFTCFLNLPVSLMGALWGNTYLQAAYHLSATNASYVTSMVFLGTVLGSPAVGWISDKLGRRKLPMQIGAILSLFIVLLVIFVPNMTTLELAGLFLILGFVSSAQIISYPLVSELNPRFLTGTSVSIVSFTCIGGYAVFLPLFGRIMDWHWSGQMANGIRVYTMSDYQFAMWILPVTFVIAIVMTLFLKESYCKYQN